ncbi:HhH-GPD-type base excision DNA repair protein [Streptomyces sp. HNM0574]|uniref:HhH-GPD-type base excision DNA repair protein n=1 Tax=Streptomyces sp. HNM0574 TaxID=2714954 RepID=UPI00146A2477|nr:HhH-GPD-type base excision DNA repair protein [Streptomyces sp. HNM0574]NLU67824.1 Fe-S cluster assembly protein HesB [Streptomyces sp. HNM0574]
MNITVRLAQQPEADALLGRDPLAVLVGALLDQQVPMEWAFTGPYTIAQRMGHDSLDAHEIAARSQEDFAQILSEKPAVHRYPGSMAKRVQELCAYLVETYDGKAERVWEEAESGRDLLGRLTALPGFGKHKAQVFTALLGKQYGVRPTGWREAAGDYGAEDAQLSVADVTGPESLGQVRERKREMKQRAKEEKERKGATGKK